MFLPQLLMSAEAAKAAFEVIKAAMDGSGQAQEKKGTIILATVKGDIHDIGKNIVKVLLENYSYESVFRLLRCGLLDLPCRDMDRLENYVLGMGIRGFRKWQEEWVLHYRGEKPEEVPEIDRIRQQLMDTLAPFTEQMKTRKGTVRERVLAFYELSLPVVSRKNWIEAEKSSQKKTPWTRGKRI